MRMSLKIVAGLAAAGVVATASSAFTATGLSTTGTAASAQFVGGTISQAVTGASISTIAYGYVNSTTKTHVNSITLTFTATEAGRAVTAVATGGTGTFTCGVTASNSSTCAHSVPGTGTTGITSLDVTVA